MQCGRAARMQEEDVVRRLEIALAREPDQPRHDLARVDRIQQDGLGTGQHLHRLDHRRVGHRVFRAPPVAMADHGLARHFDIDAQQIQCCLGFLENQRILIGGIAADTDADDRDADVVTQKPGHQPAVGARTARPDHHVIDTQAHFGQLLLKLLRAIHVAQPADRVRPAARHDVGLTTQRPDFVGRLFHCLGHVAAARHHGDRLHAHQPVHEVVPGGVRLVAARNALLDHETALQALLDRGGKRDAAMIGLRRAAGNQRIGAPGKRIAHQELQLARLVPARIKPQHIVALDPDPRAAKRPGEVRQELQGRWPLGVAAAGKTAQIHGFVLE